MRYKRRVGIWETRVCCPVPGYKMNDDKRDPGFVLYPHRFVARPERSTICSGRTRLHGNS